MINSSQPLIDIFTHILPTKYRDVLLEELPADSSWQGNVSSMKLLFDIETRFRIMDSFEDYSQVLTLSGPPIESIAGPEKAVELAQMANDGMAQLVSKYPERFVAVAACLPMNNMDAALKEVDRAINDLGFKGIQIFTPINDKPLDSPEFMPLYEKMSQYDLPIWLHPYRPDNYADYRTESKSRFSLYLRLGWPYETTTAMVRLVFSGVLERYPNLKIITHHCGAMVPFFESRIDEGPDSRLFRGEEVYEKLTRPSGEYLKKFYADTANIRLPGLICGYQFFGGDHLLFGSDLPYGGDKFVRLGIDSIGQMDISETEKAKIFDGNARRLLGLSI